MGKLIGSDFACAPDKDVVSRLQGGGEAVQKGY